MSRRPLARCAVLVAALFPVVPACDSAEPADRAPVSSAAAAAAPPASPRVAPSECTVGAATQGMIRVSVAPTKDDGSPWDFGGSGPDIAVCIRGARSIRCFPGGGDSRDGLSAPECRDSYTCTFRNVPLPAGPYSIEVIDVDATEHDTIGQGSCGADATFGQARVVVRPDAEAIAAERARLAELQRQQEAEDAAFAAMSPADHLAAARTAMDTGYDAVTSRGGNGAVARRHLTAVPSAARESRPAARMLREIEQRERRAFDYAEIERRAIVAAQIAAAQAAPSSRGRRGGWGRRRRRSGW